AFNRIDRKYVRPNRQFIASFERASVEHAVAVPVILLAVFFNQHQLTFGTVCFMRDQPRFDDLGVINNKHVTSSKVVHAVAVHPIIDCPSRAVECEEPRLSAYGRWVISDERIGHIVVKIRKLHTYYQTTSRRSGMGYCRVT